MDRTARNTFAGLVALLALFLFTVRARADSNIAYCSSQNTATDFDALWEQFQSNGWCTDSCNQNGKYAFAVILNQDCWCSNYIPEEQQDTGDCSLNCPGYPSEKCGNKDKSLYIYLKLGNSPSGTQGTSKPTSANPSSAPPSPSTVEITRDPETVVQTVTATPEIVTFTPSEKISDTPTSTPTTLRTSTTPDIETSAAAPQTSARIVTESGRVVTQTVITTPTSAPALTGSRKSKTNTSAIVGGVVGGVGLLAAIVGGVFFLLWRRRKQQKEQEEFKSGVQRNTSTMSKAGLLSGEKHPQYPPPIATTFNRRQSRTLDNESISPISGSDRRNSRPLAVDQRLNPSAIFVFDNSSRGSVASIDDSRDYHRPLNVTNPDPAPE